MARTAVGITADLLAQLPTAARQDAFWELDAVRRAELQTPEQRIAAKADWLTATLLEWGCCGQVLLVDGEPAGYQLYAPAAFVPAAMGFATAPAAGDAVLLMAGEVFAPYRGGGLGRMLVQAVVKDIARRDIRAVEAFATTARRCAPGESLLPAGYLAAVGFRTVRPHPQHPRLRLDVRSTVTWRAEVEGAVERLLGSIRASTRPASVAHSSTEG